MAGDWIKWVKGLPDKRETIAIAGRLKRSRFEVACKLMRLWEWCDDEIPSEHIQDEGQTFIALSPDDGDNKAFIDALVGIPKFSEAVEAVGWIQFRDGGAGLPNFGRHNGQTAKDRARNSKNQAKLRNQGRRVGGVQESKSVTEMSPESGDKQVTRARGEREEENLSLNSARPIGKHLAPDRSHLSHRSQRDVSGSGEEPFDLSAVDWGHVSDMAERIRSKGVAPLTVDDRRFWLKYAVLAETVFSEHWLMESIEAVVNAKERKKTTQAHFMGVVRAKAEEIHGVDKATFKAMLGRIEIPGNVWKSGVLEIRQ